MSFMPRSVIINTSNLRLGGALQVAQSFINECTFYSNFVFHIFLGRELNKIIVQEDYNKFVNIKFYLIDIHPTDSVAKYFEFKKLLKALEKTIKPLGVITVFGPCYWKPKSRHVMGFANGFLLYEDSPFFKATRLNRNIKFRLKRILHRFFLIYEADLYWTETIDAKFRLSKFLNINESRITVASNTFSSYFKQGIMTSLKEISSVNAVKLLFVSSYYEHKNFSFLPLVVRELEIRNYPCLFYITIDWKSFNANVALNRCKNIINVGPVRPADCPKYYSECDIVFVPSLLEIFSSVYPEAMISSRPIVTSNLDFAVSICGEAALYYDYTSPSDAAMKIIELIENKELREYCIHKGFERLRSFDTAGERFEKLLKLLF
jgi:glycosyltransferase involved in cell wall biosynthesis